MPPLCLKVSTDVDQKAWDLGVGRLGGSVFHTYAWAHYQCHGERREPLFFEWSTNAGTTVGRALGLRLPRSDSHLARLYTRLEFDSAPLFGKGIDGQPTLDSWIASQRTMADIEFRSFEGGIDCSAPTALLHPRLEMVRTLESGPDLLASLRKSTRYEVRRAERAGLVTDEASGAGAKEFVELYQKTLGRLAQTNTLDISLRSELALADAISALLASGRGRLFLCHKDQTPVCGCLFGVFNGTAYYLLNGSGALGRELSGTHLTLATALEAFAEEGIGRVNLGGVSAGAQDSHASDHGLFAFKRGFGGEPVERMSATVQVRPMRSRFFGLLKKALRK